MNLMKLSRKLSSSSIATISKCVFEIYKDCKYRVTQLNIVRRY
jgi:hypothetical protein